MQIDFVTEPDETGKGRVVVDGRYYGLPMNAVLEFKRLREKQLPPNEQWCVGCSPDNCPGGCDA